MFTVLDLVTVSLALSFFMFRLSLPSFMVFAGQQVAPGVRSAYSSD